MKAKIFTLLLFACLLACDEDSGDSTTLNPTGKAGSLARFALSSTHLYAVDEQSLNVYRLSENGALAKTNHTYLGADIETIYIKGSELYIGAQDGMRIFNITDPDNPKYKSMYAHITACDPVVVQDTLAFVTYRVSNCRRLGVNALDIINVKNTERPVLLSSYTLTEPYGLGVKNNLLFVCDGSAGLKIINVTNPYKPAIIRVYDDIVAQDIIIDGDRIILTAATGISQYSFTPLGQLQKLSEINVSKN